MKNVHNLVYLLFISFVIAQGKTAQDVILFSYHRLDSINHQFNVLVEQKGKKNKNYQVAVHWPVMGEVRQKIRVLPLQAESKKPSSFWEYHYRGDKKSEKWMTLPITGKLKNITEKKSKKNFSLTDIEFTKDDIKENIHKMLLPDSIGGYPVFVVESIEKTKNGDIKESKKLWIDENKYFIHKVEFYTKSDRLYRSVECGDIQIVDEIAFPAHVLVKDMKSKSEIHIQLSNILINPKFDLGIFIPIDQ